MEHDFQPEVYGVHVWIRGIHPMLWRRFLVRSDSTLADLHVLLPIAFDWTDFHLQESAVLASPFLYTISGRCKGFQESSPGALQLYDQRSK